MKSESVFFRISFFLISLIVLSGCPKKSGSDAAVSQSSASPISTENGATSGTTPTATTPAPKLVSISPSVSLATGGATLSVKGIQFADGMTIAIDRTSVTCKFVSDAQYDCVLPALAVGVHDVEIKTAGGLSSALAASLTIVDALNVTQVSPVSGATTGGFTVTITGKGFANGLKVSIGGSSCTPVTVVSATTATCQAGAGVFGQWGVRLEAGDGQIAQLLNSFTYGTPNTWRATNGAGAPSARENVGAVSTGSKVLIWGGDVYPDSINTGAQYDIATDRWSGITTTNAPSARNVQPIWTGTRMIIWGGRGLGFNQPTTNTGGMYDPAKDVWTTITTDYAPSPRRGHVSVWTGTKLLIWGGSEASNNLVVTGGLYDPAKNAWTNMSIKDAPTSRYEPCFVWTGKRMLVWGGSGKDSDIGASYDPATDTWKAMSKVGAPVAKMYQTAIWTGSKMIVWATVTPDADSTGIYDPATDTWGELNLVGGPPRMSSFMQVTWSGTKLITWGGLEYDANNNSRNVNTGYMYDPATGVWKSMTTNGAPQTRLLNGLVWAGSGIFVWGGGGNNGQPISSGGYYVP